MTTLQVTETRGDSIEARHRVHVAVVKPDGSLIASANDPLYVTYWRSAAKPFQALVSVDAGVFEARGWDGRELALTCASHSSEERHVALATEMLQSVGLQESDLACGPHRPLGDAVAERVQRDGTRLGRLDSNCSGKHTTMLALALHHDWPIEGYERIEHGVQQGCLAEVAKWTGLDKGQLGLGVDGCTVVSFALPLTHMAGAYARLVTSRGPVERVVKAMTTYPELVGGEQRLCTELMRAFPGRLVAKVGASGVYSVGLVEQELGVALKVEDGHAIAAEIALLQVLDELIEPRPSEMLPTFAVVDVVNTRGASVGAMRALGHLSHQNVPRRTA